MWWFDTVSRTTCRPFPEDEIRRFDGFHGVGLCIYESPWLRGGDPEKYMISLEENMIVACEINHYPVKLEHLMRVTKDGGEILSEYPVDPELVPA